METIDRTSKIAKIAKSIMGWEKVDRDINCMPNEGPFYYVYRGKFPAVFKKFWNTNAEENTFGSCTFHWNPFTELKDALELVAHMETQGVYLTLTRKVPKVGNTFKWFAEFRWLDSPEHYEVEVESDSMPEAITLAAVEVLKEGKRFNVKNF